MAVHSACWPVCVDSGSAICGYRSVWRWAITVYNGVGALAFLPFVRCAFLNSTSLVEDQSCRIWLDPPWMYKEIFHPNWTPGFLGFLGLTGLVIYLLYFAYFIVVRLGKQGRSATGH